MGGASILPDWVLAVHSHRWKSGSYAACYVLCRLVVDGRLPSLLKLRRLLILASISGRWAVSPSPSVTLLVEGQPKNQFLPAQRWRKGRQGCFFTASMSSLHSRCGRRWCGGVATPSGHVPGGGDGGSVLQQQEGPDRVLSFPLRVLHVKSRDWIVVSISVCPSLGCNMYFYLI